MKTRDEIEKRLRKLRDRYMRKHVAASQRRAHENCVHNREHVPSPVPTRPAGREEDLPMVPRRQVTLVVLRDDSPIRLCMYGADDPAAWPGLVCDSDDVARSCKMFQPAADAESARSQFLELMADDEYVFDNYRDIATLQWVLGERIHLTPPSLLERLSFRIRSWFLGPEKPVPALPPADSPDELWNDPDGG